MPETGFTAALNADLRADVEHPDPARMTSAERRHLGLPELPQDNEKHGRAADDQESDR